MIPEQRTIFELLSTTPDNVPVGYTSPAGRSREPVKALVGGELAPCDACGEVPLERILYARIVDGRAILRCRSCGGGRV